MTALVALQKFDGAFHLSLELCQLLHVDREAAVQRAADAGVTESDVATALALLCFESRLASLRADWQLIAAKVRCTHRHVL